MAGFRRHIPFVVACVIAISCMLLAAVATPESFATLGPEASPAVHGTKIACYRPETNRYVGRVKPSKCELWGKVEFVGYLEGDKTEELKREAFSRLGLSEIEWLGGWGRSVDRGLQRSTAAGVKPS